MIKGFSEHLDEQGKFMTMARAGNWRGSVKYWEKLVEIYSAMLRADSRSYIYIPLAQAFNRLGKVEEAIDTLEYGLAIAPESRCAKVLLAQLLFHSGSVSKSKALLEEVVEKWPDVTSAVRLLCDIYDMDGDVLSARKISGRLLNYFPDAQLVQNLVDRYAPKEAPQVDEPDEEELKTAQIEKEIIVEFTPAPLSAQEAEEFDIEDFIPDDMIGTEPSVPDMDIPVEDKNIEEPCLKVEYDIWQGQVVYDETDGGEESPEVDVLRDLEKMLTNVKLLQEQMGE